MQRKFRLTRSSDFKRVRQTGKSFAHPLVVLLVAASPDPVTRVGVAAGRTVGGAVRRNRAKRLLRAAVRPLLSDLTPGWDLVLIARQPLPESDLNTLRETLTGLLARAALLQTAPA